MSQLFASGGQNISFSFSISPSNEYSVLISFRIKWFDLLAVQETLKSLLQHHISKASILWHSAFFMVQFTSIYDSWKNHNFGYMDFCRKVKSLVFNTLSRLVMAFFSAPCPHKEQASFNRQHQYRSPEWYSFFYQR